MQLFYTHSLVLNYWGVDLIEGRAGKIFPAIIKMEPNKIKLVVRFVEKWNLTHP